MCVPPVPWSPSPLEQVGGWGRRPGLGGLRGYGGAGPARWQKGPSRSGLTSSAWCTPRHRAPLRQHRERRKEGGREKEKEEEDGIKYKLNSSLKKQTTLEITIAYSYNITDQNNKK